MHAITILYNQIIQYKDMQLDIQDYRNIVHMFLF